MDMLGIFLTERKLVDSELVKIKPCYFSGGLLKDLRRDSTLRRVRLHNATVEAPRVWRARRADGWAIVVDGIETNRLQRLSDELARVPIIQFTPSHLIVERALAGWKPEQDRMNIVEHLRGASKCTSAGDKRSISVYVEFDNRNQLEKALIEFENLMFDAQIFGADKECLRISAQIASAGFNWIGEYEDKVMKIAGKYNGTYAGNEVALF